MLLPVTPGKALLVRVTVRGNRVLLLSILIEAIRMVYSLHIRFSLHQVKDKTSFKKQSMNS